MQDQQPSPSIFTVYPFEYLKITPLNSDGSITRLFEWPTTAASPDDDGVSAVLSKDVPLNPLRKTSLRIYLPRQQAAKLPLILFIHGGGFIILNAATTLNHDFCLKVAAELSALAVSLDYRLAPEHRLPAAYDDAMDAVHWIRSCNDQWLHDFADLSDFYLMGVSAGANRAYHTGLRISTTAIEGGLKPLVMKGIILHHPFIGGTERTESQLILINDPVLPLSATDLMWELGLPLGADRDHEYCNPTAENDSFPQHLEKMRLLSCRIMVVACDGDPLVDHRKELVTMLEKKGLHVVSIFNEGGFHGLELLDLSKADKLFVAIKKFMAS